MSQRTNKLKGILENCEDETAVDEVLAIDWDNVGLEDFDKETPMEPEIQVSDFLLLRWHAMKRSNTIVELPL